MPRPTQSPIVLLLDYVEQAFRGQDKSRENVAVCSAYGAFALVSYVVLKHFSDLEFSTILTAGAGIQCFGFYLLLQKTQVQRSVAGVSSKTLEMYVLALICRLSSTLVKNGYLPVCRSGDHVYQMADAASLLLVLQLLYCVHKKYAETYQASDDSLPIWNALPGCALAAVFFHGDLNHAPFYDVMWTLSLNIETVAMLPQLFLLTYKGGEVEGLTANFVAALFFSSCCKLSFWSWGYQEIGDNHNLSTYHMLAGYYVVLAHGAQVLVSADFMYHYFRSAFGHGGGSRPMVLPQSTTYAV